MGRGSGRWKLSAMMMKTLGTLAAAVTAYLMAVSAGTAQNKADQKPSELPGGSSSLQETFDNWTLQCSTSDKERVCRVQQQQRHRESKQLLLAMEFSVGANGGVRGSAILPFGLRLASGMTLQVDESPDQRPLGFSTCLPVGCVAPLDLEKASVTHLRAGTMLRIKVMANDDGKPVLLSVPLKGLAPALDRLVSLSQSGSVSKDRK